MNRSTVAHQTKIENSLPLTRGILQRKCDCGNKTVASGECTECAKNKSGLQRKLSVGASNDPLEREADRVADQVMATPTSSRIGTSPPRIQRLTSRSTGQPDTCTPASVDRVLANSGRPLDTALQQDMGQRFGHDFSRVRVHSGTAAEQSARDVSAHAYTVGQNIVFGAGQFTPETHGGRRLLAHELTHVVQQSGVEGNRFTQGDENPALSPVLPNIQRRSIHSIQRKVKVNSGVSIDSHLINGITKSGNIYSHPGASQTSMNDQIITDMLFSPRVFSVIGSSDLDAGNNFNDHVKARKGIVDFAANKKFTFAAGTSMTMNSKYWQKVGTEWKVKPGVDRMTAMKDLNVTGGLYKIACLAATTITMIAGSGDSPIKRDSGVGADDWVPGDWGYIDNTKFVTGTTTIGLEGENVIYTGAQLFWGHFTGSNTYRSLQDWTKEVNSWNTPPGGAVLKSHRNRPNKGLA